MTIVKTNGHLQRQFPQLFDNLVARDFFNWDFRNYSDTNTTIPAANIKETADKYEVEVAAPGMNKKDFIVQLDNNILTISSTKELQQENNDQSRYVVREFSFQSFSRTFTLQKEVVDTDNIMATYENGVLRLIIPKKDEAKQKGPRQIEIS